MPAFADDAKSQSDDISDAVRVATAPSDTASTAQIEVQGKTLELELDRAIVLALRHNLGLVIERYARQSSILGIEGAQGIYDLNLGVDLSTTTSTSPATSSLQEVEGDTVSDEDDSWDFSLSQLTTWGGSAQLNFRNSRSATSDQTQIINPLYSANVSIGFFQPLLRNFGREATNRNIIVARTNSQISHEAFRAEVETIVRVVSDTYWDLVAAREQLAVSEESLELAKELHEMNRIQVEVGTLAPLEMVQSEAGVAARDEEIIRQRAIVEDSADSLRRLFNLEPGAMWDYEIVPVTEPEVAHESIDLQAAVKTALDHRADIIQQRLDYETRALDARVARNAKLPQLDLSGGLGYFGNNIAIDPETGRPITDDYGGALSQVADRDFDFWTVSLSFRYPLQNRTAKARAAQAELAEQQTQWILRDLENFVMVDVRRAARAVETAAKSIESAKVSSRLARENLEAEQKRYENGLSTSFTVLQIQEDLSEAQRREVAAVIAYRKALAAYQQAIGQILPEHHIALDGDDAEG